MNPTVVFPNYFEVPSAKGNLLRMTRLFRFRLREPCCPIVHDYVAAMETKREHYLNQADFIDVFRLDPVTGAPLWVPLDQDEIYAAARDLYDNYQSAGCFIKEYRKSLCKKFDPEQLLPHLEELEITLLTEQEPRQIILSMLGSLDRRLKVLRQLHKAMCIACKGMDMCRAADTLVITLCGRVDGLIVAEKLLDEVTSKKALLDGLHQLLLMDSCVDFRNLGRPRQFIMDTYWAQPYFIEDISAAIETHFEKRSSIARLLKLHNRLEGSCSISREDIQALWFTTAWRFLSKRYYDEIRSRLNSQ